MICLVLCDTLLYPALVPQIAIGCCGVPLSSLFVVVCLSLFVVLCLSLFVCRCVSVVVCCCLFDVVCLSLSVVICLSLFVCRYLFVFVCLLFVIMKYNIRKTRCVPETGFRARKSKRHMDLFLKCAELEKCRCVPKIGFRASEKTIGKMHVLCFSIMFEVSLCT